MGYGYLITLENSGNQQMASAIPILNGCLTIFIHPPISGLMQI